jgi:Protein of unknown function (DUF2591)
MKTAELTGAALDWAVAKCEGAYIPSVDTDIDGSKRINYGGMYPEWSTDWAQGGPIIEREMIALLLQPYGEPYVWEATNGAEFFYADKPLVAAMRCYVASELGDEIEIPAELMETV